jgi:lipase (class 2)
MWTDPFRRAPGAAHAVLRLLGAIVAVGLVLVASAASKPPARFAPLDQPGPALDVPLAQLKASLVCEPGVRHAKVEPVLLSPATGVTAAQNFSWNWEPALDKLGLPWCAYTAPYHTLGDITTSGEYLVYAIRTMYKMAGRRIAILGHSQGGMSMRWALRFWPDTRHMVDDVIGIAGDNHGSETDSSTQCIAGGCTPSLWQQFATANFVKALNSDTETFAGISYTEIYSRDDELVKPEQNNATASSALHTGGGMITNIATQSLCPGDVNEHVLTGTIDPVAYALAVDALTHPGPANPARIPKTVCSQTYMPGVNPASAQLEINLLAAAPGLLTAAAAPVALAIGVPLVTAEPPLPCYVYATCPPTVPLTITTNVKRALKGRRIKLRFTLTVDIAGVISPVPNASVWVGNGRHLVTNAKGRTSTTLRFTRTGRRRIIATAAEYKPGTAIITVSPTHRPRSRT